MNGGAYPQMQYRGIGNYPGYTDNSRLEMIINSSDGRSWTYKFPSGREIWFPWFTVILSGTYLKLFAYYEYDMPIDFVNDIYDNDAAAFRVETTLAYDVKDISSIQFKAIHEKSGNTHTTTSVQGYVERYK